MFVSIVYKIEIQRIRVKYYHIALTIREAKYYYMSPLWNLWVWGIFDGWSGNRKHILSFSFVLNIFINPQDQWQAQSTAPAAQSVRRATSSGSRARVCVCPVALAPTAREYISLWLFHCVSVLISVCLTLSLCLAMSFFFYLLTLSVSIHIVLKKEDERQEPTVS